MSALLQGTLPTELAAPLERGAFRSIRLVARRRLSFALAALFVVTMLLLLAVNVHLGLWPQAGVATVGILVYAGCGLWLLRHPESDGGPLFWSAIVLILLLPLVGRVIDNDMHYWCFLLPPLTSFVLRPNQALMLTLAFGIYAVAALAPVVGDLGTVRFAASFLVLTALCYTFAWLEAHAARVLGYYADHDPLTGCLNRRRFNQALAELDAARDQRLAVMVLDIDHFKQINDSRGHPFGDRVIAEVAERIRQALPEAQIFRIGGEEFALLSQAPGDLRSQAERVRKAIAADAIAGLPVTVSIGAVALGPAGLGPAIAEADQALYRAKAEGRNRVVLGG